VRRRYASGVRSGLDPVDVLGFVVAFLVAITVHEFWHAFSAYLLGDHTAARLGRVSLNPIRHLDKAGTLMIVLMYISGLPGFGWGKPVPFNPAAVRLGRFGGALVSAAGPLANFVTAFATALLLRFVARPALLSENMWAEIAIAVLVSVMSVNVGLGIFNLIPIPPLDGFGFLVGVLPAGAARPLEFLARYGFGILLIIFVIRYQFGFDILGIFMNPFIRPLNSLLRQVVGLG
jgi:Zn-dependent protease